MSAFMLLPAASSGWRSRLGIFATPSHIEWDKLVEVSSAVNHGLIINRDPVCCALKLFHARADVKTDKSSIAFCRAFSLLVLSGASACGAKPASLKHHLPQGQAPVGWLGAGVSDASTGGGGGGATAAPVVAVSS